MGRAMAVLPYVLLAALVFGGIGWYAGNYWNREANAETSWKLAPGVLRPNGTPNYRMDESELDEFLRSLDSSCAIVIFAGSVKATNSVAYNC